jgi:hypothetical protein
VNHVYQRTRRGAKDPSREPQATRVALGWECPLKERLPWFANGAENRLTILDRLSSILAPPTVSGAWMSDPDHKTPLDAPHKRATATPH